MSSLQQSNSVETGGEGLDDIFLTNRIFIGNLASELEEFTIYKYCSAYGEIVKCQIMKEPKTGLSRGFGFITYAQASSAQAILNARPHYIGHHKINVKSAFPTGEALIKNYATKQSSNLPRTRRIFIAYNMEEASQKNLAESAIFGFLNTYGVVKEIVQQFSTTYSNTTKQNPLNNYWIVEFMDEDSVDRCIFHGVIQYFSGIRLHLKKVISEQDILRRKRKTQEEETIKQTGATRFAPTQEGGFPSMRSMLAPSQLPIGQLNQIQTPQYNHPPPSIPVNFPLPPPPPPAPADIPAVKVNYPSPPPHQKSNPIYQYQYPTPIPSEEILNSLKGYGYQQDHTTQNIPPRIKRHRDESWR